MVNKTLHKSFLFVFLFIVILSSCRTGKGLNDGKNKPKFELEEENTSTGTAKKNDPVVKNETYYSHSLIKTKYAAQLGISEREIGNIYLYEYIDGWIGVPYKWAGNDKTGVDCSGFICAVYKDIYAKQLKRSATDIVKECETVEKDELKEGDLVFFDISSANSHVGIYLANNKFIHASSSKGVMISDLSHAYYIKYWGRAGRVK